MTRKTTFVSGCDSNYFPILLEWLHSIRRFKQSKNIDICILDAGLTTDKKAQTGADTTLFGVFYALGDSTELSLSYIEVSNDKYGTYGTGIGGRGLGTVNGEVEIIALGFLTMF